MPETIHFHAALFLFLDAKPQKIENKKKKFHPKCRWIYFFLQQMLKL
jgi:hypothetical protein